MTINLHQALERKLVLSCKLEALSPLRVGVGRSYGITTADLPLLRDAIGRPVIPGSSIRGVLRSHTERVLNSLREDDRIKYFGLKVVAAPEERIREWISAQEGGIRRGRPASEKLERFDEILGIVDRLFGVSGFASPLRLTDAVPISLRGVVVRKHVSIDLGTDAAAGGRFFDLEAVLEGSKFKFTMVYDWLRDPRMLPAHKALVKVLLSSMASHGLIIHIGGFKSRGYGLSKIFLEEVAVYRPETLAFGREPERLSPEEFMARAESWLGGEGK